MVNTNSFKIMSYNDFKKTKKIEVCEKLKQNKR